MIVPKKKTNNNFERNEYIIHNIFFFCPTTIIPSTITLGFDWRSLNLLVAIEQQSSDIANGVHINRVDEDIGAGDQVQTHTQTQQQTRNKPIQKENHAGNRVQIYTQTTKSY